MKLAKYFSIIALSFALASPTFSESLSDNAKELKPLVMIEQARVRNPDTCSFDIGQELIHPIKGCTDFFVNGSASVMFIGDSHLGAVDIQIQKRLKSLGIGSYSASYSGCVPFKGFYTLGRGADHECHQYNLSMLAYAEEIGAETLILIARFPTYIHGSRYDNGEGGKEYGKPLPVDFIEHRSSPKNWKNPERRERVLNRFESELKNLLTKFNVILFEPVPSTGWRVTDVLLLRYQKNKSYGVLSHSYDSFLTRSADFLAMIDRVRSEKLARFKVADLFCDKGSRRCIANWSNGVFYRDEDHLSQIGAGIVANSFVNNLPIFVLNE